MKTNSTIKKPIFPLVGISLALALTAPAFANSQLDTDKDGIPDISEKLIQTDPQNADTDGDGQNDLQDKAPLSVDNPIKAEGKPAPFEIKEALVEDNYDFAAKKDAPDHLELLVANTSDQTLSDFSLYYSLTDKDSGKSESYLVPLSGFEVPAKGEARIHLDDASKEGHFRANPNSAYVLSTAAKTFHIELQTAGFQPVIVDLKKDKGGAEAAD